MSAYDIDRIAVINFDRRKPGVCFDFADIDSPSIHLIAPAFKRRVHQRLGTILLAPHRRLPHKIHRKIELGFKSIGYGVKNSAGQFAVHLSWQANTHWQSSRVAGHSMGRTGHATAPVTDMVVVDLYRLYAAPRQFVSYATQSGRHDVS